LDFPPRISAATLLRMRRLAILAVTFILAVGFLAWWNSSTQVVKRRTKSLVTVLTIPASEQEGVRKVRSMGLDPFLDDSIQVVAKGIPELEDPLDREQINGAFTYFCQRVTSSDFSVKKFQSVEINGEEARVKALISVHLDLPGGDRGVSGTHEVTLLWQHAKQAWKLKSVDWNKIGP
jgi:hypothetical protein